ncbi:MAG: family hydrolase [Frankiales bacterium]|nr:family hydrolase [Frankiales bacterium]
MTAVAGEVLLTDLYDVALLDLDGVVYLGLEPVPAVAVAVAALDGLRLSYVTNNATRTPEQVWAQLDAMGCPGSAADVVTSCQAAAAVLATVIDRGAKVLVVGSPALTEAVTDAGFTAVSSLADEPAAVVQGLSLELTYAALTEAALAIRTGLPWIVTNTDATLPTARGLQPGNGAFVSALRTATGREPVAAGKPQPALFLTAAAASHATRPLVVGDRLDTDIAGAHNAGLDSLLVLSGVSSAADALATEPRRRPTYVGADIAALVAPHPVFPPAADVRTCRGWLATQSGEVVTLAGAGDPLDALRALLAVPVVTTAVRTVGDAAADALWHLGVAARGDTV